MRMIAVNDQRLIGRTKIAKGARCYFSARQLACILVPFATLQTAVQASASRPKDRAGELRIVLRRFPGRSYVSFDLAPRRIPRRGLRKLIHGVLGRDLTAARG